MKRILTIVVAICLVTGTGLAVTGGDAMLYSCGKSVVEKKNVVDKLIELINGYTAKIKKASSMEELDTLVAECIEAMAVYEEKNAKEISKTGMRLSEAERERYKLLLEKELDEFKKACSDRATTLMGY